METKTQAVFTVEIKAETDKIVAKYETRRASILEVLRFFMEKNGHIGLETEEAVAEYLEISPVAVREVMTFYTLFYTRPPARTTFRVCRTLSCALLGADAIMKHLETRLNLKPGQMSADGKYAFYTAECLGACEMAPMMQLNDSEFVGPLTKEKIDTILDKDRQ